MSRVTMDDGCGGNLHEVEHGWHSMATMYEYDGGYYDRQRRDFYGFRTVRTAFADGTYQVDEYNNCEYYAKGCIERTAFYAKDGSLLSEGRTSLCPSPGRAVRHGGELDIREGKRKGQLYIQGNKL